LSVQTIREADSDYPAVLHNRLSKDAPAQPYALGETAILRRRLLGLICSIQCPGSIVLKTFDVEDNAALLEAGAQPIVEKETGTFIQNNLSIK
jgi:hypothetical protein